MRKVVITGGPSSGKTSLIRELERRGFATVPEAATIVIKGGRFHPLKDPVSFQKEVLKLQLKLEGEAEGSGAPVVFCDRGIYDGMAYLRFYKVPLRLVPFPREWRYDLVFYLEQLPYVRDDVRFETPEEAAEIARLIREVYEELGYDPIPVPPLPIEERADLVVRVTCEKLGIGPDGLRPAR